MKSLQQIFLQVGPLVLFPLEIVFLVEVEEVFVEVLEILELQKLALEAMLVASIQWL